jgi:predicted phosphodiesterase
VVETIAESDADAVIFSGDVSTAALVREFDAARDLLSPLREKWGDRFIAIPGNHDRYTRRSIRQRLFERHVLGRETTYPFVQRLSEEVAVVGLDLSAARRITARGFLPDEQIGRIADLVETTRKDSPFVIVVGHYPLAYPEGMRVSWQHRLPAREKLAATLLRAGARLYLHGHKHWRWILQAEAGETDDAVRVGPWQRGLTGSGLVSLNPGSAGLRSDDPRKAAGFLKVTVEDARITDVQAHVVRESTLSLDIQTMSPPEGFLV